jgi:sigma-B regulation protein RsbQ
MPTNRWAKEDHMRTVLSRLWVPVAVVLAVASGAVGQSTEVATAGDTISYMTFGSGHTTLLLVHGWSNNRTFWEPHIATLSNRYRVVALDLASFGESTNHRSEWTMSRFADDAAAVLDAVDAEEVVVVGFSMGGAVAIELASRNREEVIGTVLVDILQNVEDVPTDEYIDATLAQFREGWHDPTSLRRALSPRASETLVRRYVSRTPDTVPEEWWASLRNFLLWVRSEFRPTLRRVQVPIAAINADHTPTTVEAWQRYAPGFSAHILGDVGHLGAIWERVDDFDRALDGLVGAFREGAAK